jgi:hypothetical protein
MRIRQLAPIALAIVVLTGCDASADGSGATIVETEDAAAETESTDDADEAEADEAEADEAEADEAEADEAEVTEEPEALGTRDNPLPLGTRIEMGDWTLTVSEVTLDATDLVMAENEFNDPPVDGRQFVMFKVDASYEGDDSGTAWLDFDWAIVGSAGNTFGGASMDDYCGVYPDPLDETGETFPGGSVSGNVCISAESDQVEGGTLRIEESFSFDDTRAFFSLS